MTYPLASLAAAISETGITAPTYQDILESLKASFKLIYGADAYLEADGQDGQLLAIFAQSIHDCNQATIAAYNSFSPNTAQGAGLSSVVKINHLARKVPTKSTVNLTLGGVAGTVVSNAYAGDTLGNTWKIPNGTTIGVGGSVIVTATCEVEGAIDAQIGTVTQILTPVIGWQTVTNASAATLGAPVESDAELRARQVIEPSLNSYTTLGGLVAALFALDGVEYVVPYENDTTATDANGLPRNSICMLVKGGDSAEIAQTILDKKAPGVTTYGNTAQTAYDSSNQAKTINFSVPDDINIRIHCTLQALAGYSTNVATKIRQSIVDHINAMAPALDVLNVRMYGPALLPGDPDALTYELEVVTQCIVGGTLSTSDITVAFDEKAVASLANVTVEVI